LNIMAAAHIGAGVSMHYISIGGRSAMETVTNGLIPELFKTRGYCYHMSNVTT
jgi:hypothetical protein